VALGFERDAAREQLVQYRIRSQNLHVDQLEEDVEKLEKAFEKLSDDVDKSQIRRLKARLRVLEGNDCKKNEVSCGGDIPECVSQLFVCDGHKDCTNGRDEDERVCDASVVAVGSSFHGTYHWKNCLQRDDHDGIITIVASKQLPFFTPRVWVRATITSVAGDQLHPSWTTYSYTARGYFAFGTRRLVLLPEKGSPHQLATLCTFSFGDNNHADCKLGSQASLLECASARINRVH